MHEYPFYDSELMRWLINRAAVNYAKFAAFVDAFTGSSRVPRSIALAPKDVAKSMHNEHFFPNCHSASGDTFWALDAAGLHALFGRFLDYSSALVEIAEYATFVRDVCCLDNNLWALMIAAAYSMFPQRVHTEYTRVKELHNRYLSAADDDYREQVKLLRYGLFSFARGLVSLHTEAAEQPAACQ